VNAPSPGLAKSPEPSSDDALLEQLQHGAFDYFLQVKLVETINAGNVATVEVDADGSTVDGHGGRDGNDDCMCSLTN